MIVSAKRVMILTGIAAVFVSAGCQDPKPSAKAPVMNMESGQPATSTSSAAKTADGARSAADAFLKLLTSGDAKSAVSKVAASFRKQVSGPLTFEEEIKLGYSDSDMEKYLAAAAAGANKAEIKAQAVSPTGNTVVFRGDLAGPQPRSFSLRMMKEGDGWMVSRFASARLVAVALPRESGNPELTWARQSVLDFLESLVGGGEEQALPMAAMTEELKASLPSPSVADAGLKYAKKDVRNWLNNARSGASGFAIAREEMPGGGAVFMTELTGGTKAVSIRLELAPSGDEWKIAKFDVKR